MPFFLLCAMHLQATGQQDHWQQQVDLTIDARFSDSEKSLEAFLNMEYINRSPDTLTFIWFNLWPNAFRNDRTAYSEKMLEEGRTDFYFADKQELGYINRLYFKSGNIILEQEAHPAHIDLIKIVLPQPLFPNQSVTITTPFHVRIPKSFSGIGYHNNSWYFRFWYPSPALYDQHGWHLSPFINSAQQDSFNQPANLNISITLPGVYTISAGSIPVDSMAVINGIADSVKTVHFTANEAKDFAWLAYRFPRMAEKMPMVRPFDNMVRNLLPKFYLNRYLPVAGYNQYDGLQLGMITHNFNTPQTPLTYFVIPLYAANSKKLTGIGGVSYSWTPGNYFKRIEAGINAAAFSNMEGRDSTGKKVFGDFYKIGPYIRATLPSTAVNTEKWIELKTFIIGEKGFDYNISGQDFQFYPSPGPVKNRYLNQLTFNLASYRVLYPYDAQLQIQQASDFYRINATGHYFFNYPKGGGMKVRLFASKFGYPGTVSTSAKFETQRFQPKLTAVNGYEDYTYSNYFMGRNEFEGLAAQQMMMRDGGLKLRTDRFQNLQGRSDNWIASINLNTTLPSRLFPLELPVKLFLDVGTYAEAWKSGFSSARFMYVAGIQVSLFKDLLNIYAPVLFSKEFRDNLKTVPDEYKFFKRLSFSIDVHGFGRALRSQL